MRLAIDIVNTSSTVLPSDWKVLNLSDVALLKSGEPITAAGIRDSARFPCYGGNGLRGYTDRFTHDGSYALVGRQGALCGNVIGISGKFFASEHAIVVTPRPQTDIEWLTFVLARMKLNQYSESSAQPGLSVEKIGRLKVAIPPTKTEQKAIADALSDADSYVGSLEQLIAKKRLIKQSAMQQLLTGKRRLKAFTSNRGYKLTEAGRIPSDWQVRALGELAHIKTGGRNNEDKVDDAQYPFFVRSAHVERIDHFSHDCEAILVPGEGNIGNIFHYVNGRFNVHQRVYAITRFVSDVVPKFLYFQMATRFGAHAMKNTVKATVDSLRLPTFQEGSSEFQVAGLMSRPAQ